MAGAFFGLEIGARALHAFQTALDVTAHNVANVGTRGYSRQRAQLTQIRDRLGAQFSLGGGVRTDTILRVRDLFLDQQARSAGSDSSRLSTLNRQLLQIEALVSETGSNGLGAKFDSFFNAFQQLSVNPEDPAIRSLVASAGASLAGAMRGLRAQLWQIESDITGQIDGKMTEINGLTVQIARLNEQISLATASGASPNDLLDQRDGIVEDLSALVEIDVRAGNNGTVDIFAGEAVLVRAGEAKPIPTQLNLAAGQLTDGTHRIDLSGGELAGLAQAQQHVEEYRRTLDTLAGTLIQRVNATHQAGRTLNGTTNVDFFAGTSALDIDLSAAVKADPRNIAAGVSGAVGDGAQALAMARLRDETQFALGGQTFGGYYGAWTTGIGGAISANRASLTTQSAVLDQVDAMREAVSGVSLDEEMANMMRYQRSYQAAARVVTVFDEVIQDMIERLGR